MGILLVLYGGSALLISLNLAATWETRLFLRGITYRTKCGRRCKPILEYEYFRFRMAQFLVTISKKQGPWSLAVTFRPCLRRRTLRTSFRLLAAHHRCLARAPSLEWVFESFILFSFALGPALVGHVHFGRTRSSIPRLSSHPRVFRHGRPLSELLTPDIVR